MQILCTSDLKVEDISITRFQFPESADLQLQKVFFFHHVASAPKWSVRAIVVPFRQYASLTSLTVLMGALIFLKYVCGNVLFTWYTDLQNQLRALHKTEFFKLTMVETETQTSQEWCHVTNDGTIGIMRIVTLLNIGIVGTTHTA